jgi:hypothetical protein
LLVAPVFAAWATGRPFIFPSLGPSAFALAFRKDPVTARQLIGGHAIGIVCGFLAYHLLASGLSLPASPVTWAPGDFRLGASGIVSLVLTTLTMLFAKARHAPACATTLIVSLGFMPTLRDSGTIFLAVLMLYGIHEILITAMPLRRHRAQGSA